jgi:hypothetical protein
VAQNILPFTFVHIGCGMHTDFYPVATGALYPMAEWPRDETDHPALSSVEDKYEWR